MVERKGLMKITVEDVNEIQKRLSVEIPAEDVSKEFEKVYNRLRRQVSIKGFRKGKAPNSVLAKEYGEDIREEVMRNLILDTLDKAVEDAGVELILQPQVEDAGELKEGSAFTYTALLDLWPQFELPEYKGLRLERPPVDVTDEEVDEQLEALRKHFSLIDELDEERPVARGDIAVIRYRAFIDGEEVEELCEDDYFLEVGSGNLHEKVEEALVGMAKGEEKRVTVSYPEDAINQLVAGKEVEYAVEIKDIKQRVLPDLDDDFASKVNPSFKTMDELKERLREQIRMDKEEAAQRSLVRQLLDQIVDNVDFPVPERLVESKLTQMVDNVRSHFEERGVEFSRAGISEERLRENMRQDAIDQIKTEMILDKIAEQENISLTNEEIDNYVEGYAARAQLHKEQVQQAVLQHVLPKLIANKTVNFLLEQAEIVDAPADAAEE